MWLNRQFSADLITFTEEILNEKLYFLCSVYGFIAAWQPDTFQDKIKYCYNMAKLCSSNGKNCQLKISINAQLNLG